MKFENYQELENHIASLNDCTVLTDNAGYLYFTREGEVYFNHFATLNNGQASQTIYADPDFLEELPTLDFVEAEVDVSTLP